MHNMKREVVQYRQNRNRKLIQGTSRISKTNVNITILKPEIGEIILLFLKNPGFSYPM